MTKKYDLHCHSTASDGVLSPTELVHRAYAQRCERAGIMRSRYDCGH